jgi:hypothetical protein
MRPTTRRTLEASMRHRSPVTRDVRPRQLPTVTSHAVPTGECQSDPPSLPRAIRCSRPRANPSTRAGPRDLLLHVRGLMWSRRALREGLRQAAWSTRSTVRLVAFVLSEAAAMRRAQAPTGGAATSYQASQSEASGWSRSRKSHSVRSSSALSRSPKSARMLATWSSVAVLSFSRPVSVSFA